MGLAVEGRWMAAVLAYENQTSAARRSERYSSGAQTATRSVLDNWGAALSHRSAAALWQLLPPKEVLINVSVLGIGGKKRQRGVHIHRSRTLTPEVVTSHRGIPVTTPARTIDDLQRAHRTRGCPAAIPPWELRRAIRQAEVLGLPTGAENLTKRTRSDLELLFLRLCRHHGLPRPEVNVKIGSIEVDFLWRERRVVVETDGYRYHRGKFASEDDHARDLTLRELGYEVIRLSDEQVAEEPGRVAKLIAQTLVSDS
jgi:very-short-patch-repair endonuclease